LKQLISHDFSFKVWHTHSVHGRWHAPLDRSVVIKSFIHHAIFQGHFNVTEHKAAHAKTDRGERARARCVS
jgi:hypothetical protein